ncbi:MAG: hypothetical protein ACJ8DJ_20825 [Gemmatimonadales bacterium]
MPVIGGVVETVVVAAVLLAALLVWLRRDRRHPGPRLHGNDGIDRDVLEEAEREVRDMEVSARPDDERPGDDWGPGIARPGGVPRLRP